MTNEAREKPDYCDFCDRETEDLKFYDHGCSGWLCIVCASTPASNVALYPKVHRGTNTDILKTVVAGIWMILDRLNEKE